MSISLYLLSFCLLLHNTMSAEPLYHICFSQENYTPNSPYAYNLKYLEYSLSSKVPPTGFGTSYFGQAPNRVYGLALCRGDVPSTTCKSCITEAGKEIAQRCPYKKVAIIWYDNCFFKYSSENFFSRVDDGNKFYMWNVGVVDDPESFNKKVKVLLTRVANKAYASPKLYGTGELELRGSEKLYGLAQCTRDLQKADCKKCLDGAISELPLCCSGARGGRVVGGSCNIRYELYPIVNG